MGIGAYNLLALLVILKTLSLVPGAVFFPVLGCAVVVLDNAARGNALGAATIDALVGTMARLAEIITAAAGSSVVFDRITDEQYERICRDGEEQIPDYLIPILTSLYHAVDNGEFGVVTDHVEQLTGAPAEDAERYLRRVLGG